MIALLLVALLLAAPALGSQPAAPGPASDALLLYVVALLGCTLALGGMLAWRRRKALGELRQIVERFAQGELTARAPETPDAAGVLGVSFNRLAQAMHSRQAELAQQIAAANAELARIRDTAARANAAKSGFFAAASHDLRQPMHALSLFAAALKARNRQADVADLVGHIDEATASMEVLFDALLDISRLDAGAIEAQRRHFPLQPLLDELENRFAPTAAEKALTLRVRPCDAVVHSDPLLLERILANLVSNAIRHSDDGGVLVACRKRQGQVRIEVWDSGRGIPPEQQQAVFEEFVQLDNPERDRRKGQGLGLAIVSRLAALLHHPLTLRSQPGSGSCFSVAVPLGDARMAQTEVPQPQATVVPTGTLVVLVDDDAAIVNATAEIFDSWGVDLVPARSLEDAFEWLAAIGRVPDLILCDYRLPGALDGIEVVSRMRRHFRRPIPAIVISGDTAPDSIQRIQAAGLPFLSKPLRPARLRALLAHLLQQSRAAGMG